MSSLSILAIGFLLGVKHATEPDHLTAVATLATQDSTVPQTMRLGLAWGIGHTCTLLAIAGAVVVIGGEIPESLLPLLETLVGLMLIGLGVDVIRRLSQDHQRKRAAAASPHLDFAALRFRPVRSKPLAKTSQVSVLPNLPRRALAVGMMHGMAGSAALIVLSLRSVASISEGLAYIALFGLGSMLGMVALSIILALPLRWSSRLPGHFNQVLTGVVGLLSVFLGVWTIYRAVR